jgi:hypothetical protein
MNEVFESMSDVVKGLTAGFSGGSYMPLILLGIAIGIMYIISIDWISTIVGPSISAYMTMLGSAVAFILMLMSGNLTAKAYK